MKTTSKFQLIDGVFTPDDAKNILNSMISNKIQHHDLEGFSNVIRFNLNPAHSKKRIEELNEIKSTINRLLNEIESNEQVVELKCEFEIKVK